MLVDWRATRRWDSFSKDMISFQVSLQSQWGGMLSTLGGEKSRELRRDRVIEMIATEWATNPQINMIVKRMWWDYLGFRQFFNILTFNHCSSDCPHKNLFQKQVQAEFTSLSLHDTTSSWYTWVGLSCWRHNKMPMFATTLGNRSRIYTCSLTTPPLMTLMSHSVSSSICSACHKWHGDRDTLPSN